MGVVDSCGGGEGRGGFRRLRHPVEMSRSRTRKSYPSFINELANSINRLLRKGKKGENKASARSRRRELRRE